VNLELVDFVSIPTRDTARAVVWYRDMLGLPESEFSEGEVDLILHRRYAPRTKRA
jgi:catechol 2,3-dioxygenase-like lactoylglutathione lyase family enzyme